MHRRQQNELRLTAKLMQLVLMMCGKSQNTFGRVFAEICSEGASWHAFPHLGGEGLFSEVSATTTVQTCPLRRQVDMLDSAWGERHMTIPAADREKVVNRWTPCMLGLCVCKSHVMTLTRRLRMWASKQLSKDDINGGLLVLRWQAFLLDDQLRRSENFCAGEGVAADIKIHTHQFR